MIDLGFNPYILLAINGLFTGIGVVIGQSIGKNIYNKYIRHAYKRIDRKIKGVFKHGKRSKQKPDKTKF